MRKKCPAVILKLREEAKKLRSRIIFNHLSIYVIFSSLFLCCILFILQREFSFFAQLLLNDHIDLSLKVSNESKIFDKQVP